MGVSFVYEIFFMNFWVIIILCPVFVHYNLKIKILKTFFKNLGFSSPAEK